MRYWWMLLIFTVVALALAGCSGEPTATPLVDDPPTATATSEPYPGPEADDPPTPTLEPTATPVGNRPHGSATPSSRGSVVYLPLAQNQAEAQSTVTPTEAGNEPLPPTSTPQPAYPVYEGPPLPRDLLGVQVHTLGEDFVQILGHLQNLGVGWVKAQISWKLYEPRQGQYDQDRMWELDQLVSIAEAGQIKVLLGVAKAPDWARVTTEMDGPPADPTHFGDFMAMLAERYRGRVAAYELWNESNLRREWNGARLSAAGCVALIRAGAAGVRAGDPAAVVVSGAPAPTGINDGVEAIDDRAYFRGMVLAGLAEVVDAVGVHPYGWSNPPDASAAAPDPVSPSHNDHPSFYYRDTLWDYANILAQAGAADKRLWSTEFGWGTFDGLGAPPPPGLEYMAAVNEWQQAVYTLRAFELGNEWEFVGPMFLWNLNFAPLLGNQFAESGYSLLRVDGGHRPLYDAIGAIPKTW